MGSTPQGRQHHGIDPVCCGPRKSPTECPAHRVAVLVIGVLLLFIEVWTSWHGHPDNIHLGRLSKPQGALLQRSTQHTHARRVDDAAHVERVTDWRVDVRLHLLVGLEVCAPQEHLILAGMTVANGQAAGIPLACESHHCDVPVRRRTEKASASIECTPPRQATDGQALSSCLHGFRLGQPVWPVEARNRPRKVATRNLGGPWAGVAGGPIGALQAGLRRTDEDGRPQQ
mmetsp:Transcript_52332/g.167835  ORF Transcript_52332/g.167835 Transcript_52332/m.167835 type:complete len:229 (-) Transcript_52332:334-1020(-)